MMKHTISARAGGDRRKNMKRVPAMRSASSHPPWNRCDVSHPARSAAPAASHRRTILVPIDFSVSSLEALDYGLSIAKRLKGTVTLLHVLETSYAESFLDASGRHKESVRAMADASLKLHLLAASRMERRIPMECVVREGDVEHEIARYAESAAVHVIVLGRKLRSGLSRAVFGSVTNEIVETSTRPVVVVPEGKGRGANRATRRLMEFNNNHTREESK